MMGIGGWLMYEGYKGQSIGALKAKLSAAGPKLSGPTSANAAAGAAA